jgi:hypothetical protein
MTTERYQAYCTVRDVLEDLGLSEEETELLRQTAEDLLLARPGDRDLMEEARQRAAMALSILAASRRVNTGYADELWCLIAECGPESPAPEPSLAGV